MDVNRLAEAVEAHLKASPQGAIVSVLRDGAIRVDDPDRPSGG